MTSPQNYQITNGAWNGQWFIPESGQYAQSGKYQWDMHNTFPNATSIEDAGAMHQLEYVPGYGWFCLNADGTCFGDVTPTSATSGTYLDANGNSQSFTTNLASVSNGVVTINHPAPGNSNITFNETDLFTNGLPSGGQGGGSGDPPSQPSSSTSKKVFHNFW